MSFYNGLRVSHTAVDERDWDLNQNTITLDDDAVIDVSSYHYIICPMITTQH